MASALTVPPFSLLFLSPNLPTHTSLTLSPPASRSRSFKITFCVSIKQPNDPKTRPTQNDAVATLRVAFAAGGTGGHIYPAVAIADELKRTNPATQILFLGTPNSMESTAITAAGYAFDPVPAVRLARPVFLSPRNLLVPFRLIKSILQSFSKLKAFGPHIVVGTGGFVSFPTCFASVFLRESKLVIQEQNSVPGVANLVLSHFSDVVFVAFNSTVDCFPKGAKCVISGNPVRLSINKDGVSKAAARARFFPRSANVGDEEAKLVLVLGGSLGANPVNIAMLNVYHQMLMENEKLFIIWQTGVQAFNEMESLVKNHPNLHLTPFMHSMDLAYLAGDLVISRAGAMTCSEILAYGKPSILIPAPNVAEGHQFKNASLMADLADARIINEDELDSTTLKNSIEELLGDEEKMADMSQRALKAAKLNASAEIAQHILSLIDLSTTKKQQ